MTTISLLSLWFYRSCVCTVVLTSTFFSNSRHRGIIARKTWESQISLTNSKIPWLFSKFQISLTNYKIPWLFPDLQFLWLFPDQWQPCEAGYNIGKPNGASQLSSLSPTKMEGVTDRRWRPGDVTEHNITDLTFGMFEAYLQTDLQA